MNDQKRTKRKRRKARPSNAGVRQRQNSDDNASLVVADSEKNNTFGGNSIEWYSRYPNLLLAAGSIPYPYRPGMAVPLGNAKPRETGSNLVDVYEWIPGMLRIDWMPSVGKSNSPTSPISVVGKEMYAKVREKFSGAIDADAPDFVVYLLALDSIFSYIAMLKRLYRVINAYSPENMFTPDGFLAAMGFSAAQMSDLRQTKMQLYQQINELILMTYKFKCPRVMDLFNRHVWLNDHIYLDAPTTRGQFYMFYQTQWYKFSLVPVPGSTPQVSAGGLVYATPWAGLPDSGVANRLFQFGRSLIDALASSDDGYLISGYLMRAYEGVPDFRVDELLLGETLIPKYNEEVLGEIENLHTIPAAWIQVNNTIAQDPETNAIIANPQAVYPAAGNTVKFRMDALLPRFNSRSDAPTVAETVVNSRLMSYIGSFKIDSTAGTATADIISTTEIVTNMVMTIQRQIPGAAVNWKSVSLASDWFLSQSQLTSQEFMDRLLVMAKASQWDWMPMLYMMIGFPSGSEAPVWTLIGDIHNITTTSFTAFQNINTVCLYSLFNAFSA